jgi:ubiquinone/menaquinone biosynthesis C-methylase UbiE
VRFEVGDASALPWAPETCDATVSGLVLNFVPDSAAMTREMARVTRPGGRVALKARLVAAADGSIAMTARAWAVQGTVPPLV